MGTDSWWADIQRLVCKVTWAHLYSLRLRKKKHAQVHSSQCKSVKVNPWRFFFCTDIQPYIHMCSALAQHVVLDDCTSYPVGLYMGSEKGLCIIRKRRSKRGLANTRSRSKGSNSCTAIQLPLYSVSWNFLGELWGNGKWSVQVKIPVPFS